MASIGQIKIPNDNNNYNLSVPFVIGTGSTAGTWLGTLTGLTAYYDGLLILYKPSIAGATTTTLNLNSLGAKTCYLNNGTKLTTHYPANQPILLVYSSSQNSGCWMAVDNYNSDTYPSALCTTAAGTAAKAASCSYYTATANTYIPIVFRYANTYAGAITLNINSQGAKPVYINRKASSANNYTLPAGSYIAFYDGTNYYINTDETVVMDVTSVTGHSVDADVPANAVFTDTTYESKSAVSGGTDVSLVTTGEKYNWNNMVYRLGINSSNYGTIWGVGSYSVLLVFGFVQGIGCVSLIVNISNNALSVMSMGNGSAWSSSNLTFAYNSTGKYVTISSPQSAYSYLTVIKGGIS